MKSVALAIKNKHIFLFLYARAMFLTFMFSTNSRFSIAMPSQLGTSFAIQKQAISFLSLYARAIFLTLMFGRKDRFSIGTP